MPDTTIATAPEASAPESLATLPDLMDTAQQQGLPPEQTAKAIGFWRDDMRSQIQKQAGDDTPTYFKAGDLLDQDVSTALGQLAQQSRQPDNPVFQSKRSNAPFIPINGPDGAPLGSYRTQAGPAGHTDVQLGIMAPDGKLHTGLLQVKPVTEDDVQAERAKAQQEIDRSTAEAESANKELDHPSLLAGLSISPTGGGSVRDATLKRAADARQRARQSAERLQQLSGDDAAGILQHERVLSAFKGSPLAKQAGQWGVLEDIQRGFTKMKLGVQYTAADVFGHKQDADEVREALRNVDQAYPGTTRPTRTAEEMRGLQEMGGSLPAYSVPYAGPAVMAASAYGESVAHALDAADAADQSAALLEQSHPDMAQQLHAMARQMREDSRVYGALSAATMALAGKVIPKADTFLKTAARGGAEMAGITTVQGQVLDPTFLHQRGNPIDILKAALIGAGSSAAVHGVERAVKGPKPEASGQKPEDLSASANVDTTNGGSPAGLNASTPVEGSTPSSGASSPSAISAAFEAATDTVPLPAEAPSAQTTPPQTAASESPAPKEAPPGAPSPSGDVLAVVARKPAQPTTSTDEHQVKSASASGEAMIAAWEAAKQEAMKQERANLLQGMAPARAKKLAGQSAASIASHFPNVGDTVTYEGYTGKLGADEEGRPVVHLPDGKTLIEIEPGSDAPRRAGTVPLNTKPGTWKHPMEAWADELIADRYKRTNSLPLDVYTAMAVKGAFHIARGLRDFTQWSARMIADFGRAIAPHLRSLWDSAHSYVSDALQAARKTSQTGAVINPFVKPKGPAVRYSDDLAPVFDRLRRWTKDQMVDLRSLGRDLRHGPQFNAFKALWNRLHAEGTQANALATDALHKAIVKESGNEPMLRAAWGPWREAGGDAALLTFERDQLLKQGRQWAARIWDRAIAATQSPKDQAFFQQLNQVDDGNLARGQRAGVLGQGIANHVTHLWELPRDKKMNRAGQSFVSKLSNDYQFGKKRKLGSFFEGISLGLQPRNMDAADLLGLQTFEMNKTIATRRFFHDALRTRMADGRPIATLLVSNHDAKRLLPHMAASPNEAGAIALPMTTDGRIAVDANGSTPLDLHDITDFTTHDLPSMRGWHFVAPDQNGKPIEVQGDLAWHPETHKFIANRLGKSRSLRDWTQEPADSPAGYVARKVVGFGAGSNSLMKQSLLGLIAAFHAVQEFKHYTGHYILSGFKNSFFRGLKAPDYRDVSHLDAMRHGLQVAGDSEAMKIFSEGFNAPILQKIPGIGPWIQIQSQWLFHSFIPALKLKTYQEALQRNLRTYASAIQKGTHTADDVKYLTAKQVNAAYGELNYHDMGRSKAFQEVLRALLLAPDFLEARAKFVGNAMQGLAGQKQGREAIKTYAAIALTTYVAARVINGLLNDGDTKNDLDNMFAVVHGNRRFTMRDVVTDTVEAFRETRKFVRGRMSPAFQIEEMVRTGMNYRGEPMTGKEIAAEALMRGVPMQVSALPFMRNLTATGRNNPVSAWEQLMGTLGLHIQAYSPITEFSKRSADFAESAGKARGGAYPPSAFTPLRHALEDQDWDTARAELATLTQTRNPEQIGKAFHQSLFHSWTGDGELDRAWLSTLTGDNQTLHDQAEQLRTSLWHRFLQVQDHVPSTVRLLKDHTPPPAKPKHGVPLKYPVLAGK
jgi:hypothetical protein